MIGFAFPTEIALEISYYGFILKYFEDTLP